VNLKPISSDCFSVTGLGFLHAVVGIGCLAIFNKVFLELTLNDDKLFLLGII